MIRFHVDDHNYLQEYANNKYDKYGDNVSVRAMNKKPIIIFGQDESVFNQFAFGSKQWVGDAGERAFLPKRHFFPSWTTLASKSDTLANYIK